jgi:hypothetical protein
MERTEMVGVMVRLPKSLHIALKRQADAEERSMAQIMKRALRDYLAARGG